MIAYRMSWWDIYYLPVPTRKWLITRYNKYMQSQNAKGSNNSNEPLSQAEKMKMIKSVEQGKPVNSQDFMSSSRNRK